MTMLQLYAFSSPTSGEMGRTSSGGQGQGHAPGQGLPSPTLTNPDMVLPDRSDYHIPTLPPTPPRDAPPSVTYLREQASAPALRDVSTLGGVAMAGPKKEKRGLMSRKMLLLRSRTASSSAQLQAPRSTPADYSTAEDQNAMYASSPTLMDVGNLLPETPARERRPSATGTEDFSDDNLAGMPHFLAKYDAKDAIPSDDEFDDASPAAKRYGYSVNIEGGLDEKRRKQEEDEQNSAILSKRAEHILANAKKRLNLMEGNLRGARDLVAPLTAANLKRATSVSSSHVTPASIYGNRSRPVYDGYHYDPAPQRTTRTLQTQASSPSMSREFYQGHLRGFSETEVPERPYTSMERTNSPIRYLGRFPVKAQEAQLGGSLRGSRSFDSLGGHVIHGAVARDPHGRKGSPDSNLEPLAEDDGSGHLTDGRRSRQTAQQGECDQLGRPVSRTEDLREQMSSLRGRISSLKERAREDSLRRQSMQNLREPSPLNNASATAPEYFYTSSSSYGSPALDTNAGRGWKSKENSPITPQSSGTARQSPTPFTGSRNAFAERPERMPSRNGAYSRGSPDKPPRTGSREEKHETLHGPPHCRTSSGTAIVQASKHRYSHHQSNNSVDMPGAFDVPSPDESQSGAQSNGLGIRGTDGDFDDFSEAGASEYEDAPWEQAPTVVAHEDREDAFDYEHFFLHSAMGTYGMGDRSSSPVSSESASSVETARGPTAVADDGMLNGFDDAQNFPPATPETPEKLREIERNLHKRTFSDESISTLATFATATEGRGSPELDIPIATPNEWPLPAVSRSAPSSRPSTAIPTRTTNSLNTFEHRSDSSSERADSGVGIATSTNSRHHYQKSAPAGILHPSPSITNRTVSPPMSPRSLQNPATLAVNALLEPHGRTLGLRDKASLFGVVEQLRVVCRRLQDGQDGDAREMQRRLEEARRVLEGCGVGM